VRNARRAGGDLRRRAQLPASLLGCAALAACAQPGTPAGPTATTPPAVAYEGHVAAGGIIPPGGELRNPHANDPAVARNGALLFAAMNCDGCHGGAAVGNIAPNLADGRFRYGAADAEVFSSIYYGRPRGMPAFGGVVGTDGVWSLVTYIRSLPAPSDEPTESWEEP
jgi:cytochrome c oxidase cbb3-type subunit III